MNRKEKTQDKTEGQKLIERLNKIIKQIRGQAEIERIENAEKERSTLPEIFQHDDELWQKREGWRLASQCYRLVVTGKAAEYFELSSVEQHNARTRIEMDLFRAEGRYFQKLVEILLTIVRDSLRGKEELVRWSFAEETDMPSGFLDSFFWDGAVSECLIKFDEFCWPKLPPYEKRKLRTILETEAIQAKLRLFDIFLSMPKAGKLAMADLFSELEKNPDKLVEDGLAGHVINRIGKYQSKKRHTKKQKTEDEKKEARRKKAIKLWPKILESSPNRSQALHEVLIAIGEPGYKKNIPLKSKNKRDALKNDYRRKDNKNKRDALNNYLKRQKL